MAELSADTKTDTKALVACLLAGQYFQPPPEPIYDRAYEFWKDVWNKTFTELDVKSSLLADQFTRQHLIAALFLDEDCVGLVCFRKTNLAIRAERDDSWFQVWPPSEVVEFGSKYPKGVVINWFSVHPNYRRTTGEGSEWEIATRLTELVTFVCLEGRYQIAFTCTRNDRSVNQLAMYGGGREVGVAHLHGIEVSRMVCYPQALKLAAESFPQKSHELWRKRKTFIPQ